MILKLLCIALVGAAFAQAGSVGNVFPGTEDNNTILSLPSDYPAEVGNSENEFPDNFVQQNTEDWPAEVTTVASVLTQGQVQNPNTLTGVFQMLGGAVHEVVDENANGFKEVFDSMLGVGQSVLHATNKIVENKMKAALSIPRIRFKIFEALSNQPNT